MMYKKHIAAGLPYVPIYSSLTGLELKPSTIIRPRRPDQSYIPEIVGSASAGGLSHLQKLMGILGKEKMGILLKISYQSETAFHAACGKNRLPVIEFLYSNFDIDLEGTSGRVGITPLFNAVVGRATEATRWLAEHGANKDHPIKSGKTPYGVAVKLNLTEILTILDDY
jgi:hypothetical protein